MLVEIERDGDDVEVFVPDDSRKVLVTRELVLLKYALLVEVEDDESLIVRD